MEIPRMHDNYKISSCRAYVVSVVAKLVRNKVTSHRSVQFLFTFQKHVMFSLHDAIPLMLFMCQWCCFYDINPCHKFVANLAT